jgi:hypothetical protein
MTLSDTPSRSLAFSGLQVLDLPLVTDVSRRALSLRLGRLGVGGCFCWHVWGSNESAPRGGRLRARDFDGDQITGSAGRGATSCLPKWPQWPRWRPFGFCPQPPFVEVD